MKSIRLLTFMLLIFFSLSSLWAGDFKNFKVAVYCRAYEVEKMADLEWLD